MDNDYLSEKEKEELSKKISKKDIYNAMNMIPPKMRLPIVIVSIVTIFLLIFVVLVSALSATLFFNQTDGDGSTGFVYIDSQTEDNYWWPIGGSEVITSNGKKYAQGTPTSTRVTSNFSLSRTINGYTAPHYGMDIGASGDVDYIIAVEKGTVYSANNTCDNNGKYNDGKSSKCGGGFGNFVIIEHPGSVYTIYAHLYPNSVTVSVGDIIDQGQIIGRMGNSGNSTGTHLHFQLEIGGRASSYAVDPLEYISTTDTRPKTVQSGSNLSSGNKFIGMLHSWESSGPTEGDYYKVYDDDTGVLTVGYGVALKYNVERFAKRNIDVSTLSIGSKIEKNIVDAIEAEELSESRKSVEKILANNNIKLEEYQIEALIMRYYNVGNINSFPDNYKKYGNTQSLYDNYMSKPVTGNGKYMSGLARRRQAEWNLFYNGIYTYNS